VSVRLSTKQERIVNHQEGPLLVLAGPGSGKTRVLVERVRRLLSESQGHFRVLALTFTNKAANEMTERLAEFHNIGTRAFIGTLHSFCMEVLSSRGSAVGIDSQPHILEAHADRKLALLQAATDDPVLRRKLNLTFQRDRGKLLDEWLHFISEAKGKLIIPEMVDDEGYRRAYEAYNAELQASNTIDFDDLLLLTYQLFEERPKVAAFYRRLYRYTCIDEAQDLNEAQYHVLRSLCGTQYSNVMMVGDPKQAIYMWNGANPKYLDLFESDFGATRYELHENFRCSKAVAQAARALFNDYFADVKLPVQGKVEVLVGDDEEHEACLVLDAVEDLVEHGHTDIEEPITLERIAILGRTRYVLSAVEEDIKCRGWSYHKQLSANHESESDLVKDFELALKLLANPDDRLHLGVLLKRWNLSSSLEVLKEAGDIWSRLSSLALSAAAEAVIAALGRVRLSGYPLGFLDAIRELETFATKASEGEELAMVLQDLRVWQRHWDMYCRTEPGRQHSLNAFLSKVALGNTQQPRQEGLALLTVHSAKGLEYDVVFVMGMAEGVFPDYRAKGEALEEERRNAFVAVTRSRRLLGLSYPQTRVMPWGDVWEQKPSQYLRMMNLI